MTSWSRPARGRPRASRPSSFRSRWCARCPRAPTPAPSPAAARVVRRVSPTLVHAHSSKAGAVARLARPAFPRTPLVYTPHGYAFAGFFESERERARYRAVERALAPAGDDRAVRLRGRAAPGRIGRPGAPHARGPQRRARSPSPAPPHPAWRDLRERGPVWACVTLLRPGKGLETLVDALPQVLAAHPDAPSRWRAAAPTGELLEARARERGRRRGAPPDRRDGRPDAAARRRRPVRERLLGGVVPLQRPRGDGGRPARRGHRRGRHRRGGRARRDAGWWCRRAIPAALGAALSELLADPDRRGRWGRRPPSRGRALHARSDDRRNSWRLPRTWADYHRRRVPRPRSSGVRASSGASGGRRESVGEERVEVRRYLDALTRSRWMIVAVVLLMTGIVVGVSLALPDSYRATTRLVLEQDSRPLRRPATRSPRGAVWRPPRRC